MLDALLERLRFLTVSKQDEQWGHDSKELRAMIDDRRAEMQAELEQLAEAASELDYMDAMADSFSGGPDNDNGEAL